MGNVMQDYARIFHEERLRSRKLLSLFLCLSIFVSSGVLWQLKMVAVSADDAALGVSYIQQENYTNKVVVRANWDDNGASHVGDSIKFDLMADTDGDGIKEKVNVSDEIQYEVLSNANNWTMTFEHMPDLSYEVIVKETNASNVPSGYAYNARVTSIVTTPTPSIGRWELVTGDLSNGEYLIVYNNQIVTPNAYNNVWTNSEFGPHPFASSVAFDESNAGLSSYVHRYSEDDNTFIYNTYNASGQLQDLYFTAMSWNNGQDGQFVYYTGILNTPTISGADASGNRTITYGNIGLDVNNDYFGAVYPSSDTTQVKLYRYNLSVDPNEGSTFTYTLTNTLRPDYSGYGGSMNVPVTYSKTIDRLDDNFLDNALGNNPDTEVCGDDFYRLYLDVTAGTNPPIGTDLVIVVDQSWSMNSAVSANDSMQRSQALYQILNGNDTTSGLVQSFLNDNSLNNVAVVGFDGMRFRDRATMPHTPDEYSSGYSTHSPNYLEYTSRDAATGNNTSPFDGVITGYNDTLESWGYDYTNDTQILLGWCNSDTLPSDPIRTDATLYSGTNYEAALMRAYDMFNSEAVRNDGNNKILIFISDGVPTCFIADNSNGGRREGTTLEGPTNVSYCSGPSIAAFDEFIRNLNTIDGFNPAKFSSYAIGVFDQNLSNNISVLSNYVVGDGRLMFCNNVSSLRKELEDIMLQNPYEVTISDTLSSYVEYYGIRPDVKLTMTSLSGGEPVVLYENGAVTAAGEGKLQSISYDSASRTITAVFNPAYYLEYGYTYTLSYNVRSNEYAYNEYAENAGYNQAGDLNSDYSHNASSSERGGFRSNDLAQLRYRFKNRTNPIIVDYDHPVIQIDSESYVTGSVTVNKLWVDENGNSITPVGEVRLELHQVGTFVDGVTMDRIVIDNVYNVDGQDYVVIPASNNMQHLYSSLPTAGFQDYTLTNGRTERLRFDYTYYVIETSSYDGFTSVCAVSTVADAVDVSTNPSVNVINQYAPTPVPTPTQTPTNTPEELPRNQVALNKTIDDLGDGVVNPDTDLRGTDYYRIYLEAISTYTNTVTDNSRGVDLVLVLDQSWSMAGNSDAIVGRDADGNPITVSRQEALNRVVNGYGTEDGLIKMFLESNPSNRIAVVGFDGMRFRDRATMPHTPDEYSNGWATHSPNYLDYNSRQNADNGNNVPVDDEDIRAFNDALEEWGYTYENDTQILLNWSNSTSATVDTSATLFSGTNYEAALMRAYDVFNNQSIINDGNDKVLVFISDGVPTCFIDNSGTRRDGTTLEGADNVTYCTGPSIEAFNNFIARLNAIPGFDSSRFSSYSIAIFDQNLYNNTSVLSNYIVGNGRLMYCDDVTSLRTNLSNAMGVQSTVTYPNNVVIKDSLSQYVDFYTDNLDVVVAMTSPDGVKTVLYENGVVTTAGQGVIQSVQYSLGDKSIECRFEPNYALLENYVYALSFNTKVTEVAYDDFESNSYTYNHGTIQGDQNTDFGGNTSSSGQYGFYSNTDAEVTYKDERGPHSEDFPHPVIQVDTGQIEVHKIWSDGTSIIPPNQVPIRSSVNVELHQVATLVPESVPTPGGRWVLVEDNNLTDGEYLIVANNRIVDPYFYADDLWSRSTTGPHPHTNNVTFNATNASLRSYVHKYTVANGFTYYLKDSDGEYKDLRLMCHYWSNTNPEFVYASQRVNTSTSNNYFPVTYSSADADGYRTLESRNNNSYRAGLDVENGNSGAMTDVSNSTRVQFYRYVVIPEILPDSIFERTWGEATITAEHNWTYTFDMLPKSGFVDVDGVPVKYTFTYYVVETTTGPFDTAIDVVASDSGIYDGNTTLVDGVVNITNTINVNYDFTLPNAGGVGIYQFLMIGSAIVSIGLFYDLFIRKKRERRQLSG